MTFKANIYTNRSRSKPRTAILKTIFKKMCALYKRLHMVTLTLLRENMADISLPFDTMIAVFMTTTTLPSIEIEEHILFLRKTTSTACVEAVRWANDLNIYRRCEKLVKILKSDLRLEKDSSKIQK